MGTSGDDKPGLFRRHRGKLIALAAVCVVGAVGWALIERYVLDMERYRRLAIDTLAERTGIDAKIARLEADLVPTPRLVAHGIELSAPEGSASVRRVTARLDLWRLVRREVAISSIDVGGLSVRLVDDPGEIAALRDRVRQTWIDTKSGGDPGVAVALDSIQTAGARLFLGEANEEFVSLDVRVDDALSDRIGVNFSGPVAGAGDRARLAGELIVMRDQAAKRWQVAGSAEFHDAELDRLPFKNVPAGTADATVRFTPAAAGPAMTLRLTVDTPEHPALSGDLLAEAAWEQGAVKLINALWDAPGARAEASGEFASADDWSARVAHARITDAALDGLLAMAERPRARFEADAGAYVDLKDFDIRPDPEGRMQLASGTLDFTGLAIVPRGEGAANRAAHGIRGAIAIADNVITIEEIRADAVKIAGTLTPDFKAESVFVNVRADADLARLPWDVVDALEGFQRIEGDLELGRVSGTFARAGNLPDDFVLEGELRNGAMVYADEDVHVDVHEAAGRLTSDGGAIRTYLDAFSSGAAVTVSGAYDAADRRWTGVLETDVTKSVPAIFVDDRVVENVRPVANVVGPAAFDVDIALPMAGRDDATIDIARRGETALRGKIVLAGGTRLASVSSEGTLPIETLLSEYFPRLSGTGHAGFAVNYKPGADRIAGTIDASDSAVESESFLSKASGTGLVAKLDAVVENRFSIESLEISVNGTTAVATTAPPQAGVIPFEVNVGALQPLFTDGARAGGVVLGRYDTNATAAELKFDGVALAVSDVLALDRINGPLLIFKDSIATDGLEFHGARSDCVLRVSRVAGRWSGGIRGESFNLHAITELVEAIEALMPGDPEEPAAEKSFWEDPILGEFEVDLAAVHYNRGRLDDVRFRLIGDERALRVRDVKAQPRSGTITASLAIVPDPGVDAILKLTVNATDLDAKTINDLFWAEDKAFFGTIGGSLVFDAPLGDIESMLAQGDGALTWAGTNGSLGQIGFATKLLTALKTTDILNLRLRSLRDQGITYDTWDVDLRMTDGVADIETFFLDGGAYTIQADGTIDFAKDETDALVYVRPLESVGRVIKKVPLLGNLAAAVSTDLLGVPVRFSGSPYDAKASVAKELAKGILTAPIRAGQGAVKSVTGDPEKKPERPEGEKEAPSPQQDVAPQ